MVLFLVSYQWQHLLGIVSGYLSTYLRTIRPASRLSKATHNIGPAATAAADYLN